MEIKANLDAVLVGRILAAVVIIFSFAYSVKAATAAYEDEFWVFLGAFMTPAGAGVRGNHGDGDSEGVAEAQLRRIRLSPDTLRPSPPTGRLLHGIAML